MPNSLRDRLFARGSNEVDPAQAVPRDGERGAEARAALPTVPEKVATRRQRRDQAEALREAERRRAAGEKDIDYNPNRRRGVLPLVIALVLVLVGGAFAWNSLGLSLPSFSRGGGDYAGSGDNDTTQITIHKGDSGSTVGSTLVGAGVTKSTSAFVEAMAAMPNANLQPGVYKLKKKQSALSALNALLDPKNRVGGGIVIQEGLWQSEIIAKLSKATGHPVSEYQKVTAAQLGLPATMHGKFEGWLFPSTYDFDTSMSAKQQLQAMVDNTRQQISSLNIPADQVQKVLTEASIVQAESPNAADDGKVARVIANRLAKPMKLQMDSSIHYIEQRRGNVSTSIKETQNPSPYNSYRYEGLPPTPYNSPGLAAIKAAANPTPGNWLYFTTVNQATGETRFEATYAEHERNVAEYEKWCNANPSYHCSSK